MEPNVELSHHGVKGMKWGVRRKKKHVPQQSNSGRSTKTEKLSKKTAAAAKLYKEKISKMAGSEMAKRGKAALDVLQNGDSDWMGRPINSDNSMTELRNRGQAALERLMYSEDQVFNKKFYGRYNF